MSRPGVSFSAKKLALRGTDVVSAVRSATSSRKSTVIGAPLRGACGKIHITTSSKCDETGMVNVVMLASPMRQCVADRLRRRRLCVNRNRSRAGAGAVKECRTYDVIMAGVRKGIACSFGRSGDVRVR